MDKWYQSIHQQFYNYYDHLQFIKIISEKILSILI